MSITTKLTVSPGESGTLKISGTFKDETGAAATPATLTYSLTDSSENVIDSLKDQTITAASSFSVVLSGTNLALTSAERAAGGAMRYFALSGTYNSSSGTGLRISTGCSFKIEKITGHTPV